jgi:hypothetical protein
MIGAAQSLLERLPVDRKTESKPHHLAVLEWARTAVGICFLLVGAVLVRHGSLTAQIMAITVARLVTGAFIVTPAFLYILMRRTRISLSDLFNAVVPSLISAVGVVAIVLMVRSLPILSTSKPIIVRAAEIIFCVIAGVPIILLMDPQLRRAIQQRFVSPRVSSLP